MAKKTTKVTRGEAIQREVDRLRKGGSMTEKKITGPNVRRFVQANWTEIAMRWASELDKIGIIAEPPEGDQPPGNVMFIDCHRPGTPKYATAVNLSNVIIDVAVGDRDADLTYDVRLNDPVYRQQKEMRVIRASVITTRVLLDNYREGISKKKMADLVLRTLAEEGIPMDRVRVWK